MKDTKRDIKSIFDNLNKRNIKYDHEHYNNVICNYFRLKIEIEEARRHKNKINDMENIDKEAARQARDRLKVKEHEFNDWEEKYNNLLMPNILHESVPNGLDSKDNVVIHTEGEINFTKHHYDVDMFVDVSHISGSRFVVLKDKFAKLERALMAYAMDRLANLGFEEFSVPYIMNKEAAKYTRHDKDMDDMFTTGDKFLIPTGENQLLCLAYKKKLTQAPWKICTVTDCFRKEAGAAGKDTKGLIRLHQFKKVEMVIFTKPEDSYNQLEIMTSYTEDLLRSLGLPFRRILLCSGDTGIRSAKTYDLEVFIGKTERECASISNCEDYQTRILQTKYDKEYAHALNGTYLASGRILAAIVEHYLHKNIIRIPQVLHKYTNFTKIEV